MAQSALSLTICVPGTSAPLDIHLAREDDELSRLGECINLSVFGFIYMSVGYQVAYTEHVISSLE